MYIDIKDKAKMLRTDLKKMGYNSKQISVTVKHYTSINVKIKDVTICKKPIEAAAKKYESINYDQANGEILSGGNDFVFVEYDWQALKDARQVFENYCNEIIEKAKSLSWLPRIFENETYKIIFHHQKYGNQFIEVITNNERYRYTANSGACFAESLIKIQADHELKLEGNLLTDFE